MFDTIKVGFKGIKLPSQWLSKWKNFHRSGNCETYHMLISAPNGNKVSAIYHPTDFQGNSNPLLLFEYSAPKILHNCNHVMINDIFATIEPVNDVVHRCRDFSSINIEDGKLYRIDYCFQYMVGDLIYDYIRVLQSLHYPHRKCYPYQNNGVQFRSGQVSTQFYDKFEQCNHEEAKGFLRHETSFRDKSRIEELLGMKDPTIRDLDIKNAISVLNSDLKKLRLKDSAICNRFTAHEILMSYYGKKRGINLVGYLTLRQAHSREQLIEKYNVSRETINRNERDIAQAGVAPIFSKNVILPPLEVKPI